MLRDSRHQHNSILFSFKILPGYQNAIQEKEVADTKESHHEHIDPKRDDTMRYEEPSSRSF